MRFKFNKKKYASLILVFLMLGSTVTFGALQSIKGLVEPEESEIELPDSNVVNYEITSEQKSYMIRIGVTIVEYRYSLACTECTAHLSYIESAAAEFSDQIFVQEIADNSVRNSTILMNSYYGEEELENPSNEDIFDMLCELMIRPPVICAARNV